MENHRNNIIHQKSIEHTEFYKSYFKNKIFDICNSPEKVIRFFYDSQVENKKTNPIWPWLKNAVAIPMTNFDKTEFEVIGNIHEGFKKKK